MRMLTLLTLLLSLMLATTVEAQRRGGGGRSPDDGAGMVERREANIVATGLAPAFPAGLACEPISSPYGSPTRYDGSLRRDDRNGGLHGGMDLSLQKGTPLLAIAAGEVIAKGAGGRLEGNFLWLRIAPEDSSQPFWTFAKYQHLAALPTLEVGARVTAGQPVALSGSTGTAGGHYGAAGYPHLHLSTHYGPSPEFALLGMFASLVKAKGAQSGDPMAFYLRDIADPAAADKLPADQRRVGVPVVASDGTLQPAGSRTVWPVACRKE